MSNFNEFESCPLIEEDLPPLYSSTPPPPYSLDNVPVLDGHTVVKLEQLKINHQESVNASRCFQHQLVDSCDHRNDDPSIVIPVSYCSKMCMVPAGEIPHLCSDDNAKGIPKVQPVATQITMVGRGTVRTVPARTTASPGYLPTLEARPYFYFAICCLLMGLVCVNPCTVCGAIVALAYTTKAARTKNRHSHIQAWKDAQRYLKNAQYWNVCTLMAYVFLIPFLLIAVLLLITI